MYKTVNADETVKAHIRQSTLTYKTVNAYKTVKAHVIQSTLTFLLVALVDCSGCLIALGMKVTYKTVNAKYKKVKAKAMKVTHKTVKAKHKAVKAKALKVTNKTVKAKAHITQSMPNSGLGLQRKFTTTFQIVFSSCSSTACAT